MDFAVLLYYYSFTTLYYLVPHWLHDRADLFHGNHRSRAITFLLWAEKKLIISVTLPLCVLVQKVPCPPAADAGGRSGSTARQDYLHRADIWNQNCWDERRVMFHWNYELDRGGLSDNYSSKLCPSGSVLISSGTGGRAAALARIPDLRRMYYSQWGTARKRPHCF